MTDSQKFIDEGLVQELEEMVAGIVAELGVSEERAEEILVQLAMHAIS